MFNTRQQLRSYGDGSGLAIHLTDFRSRGRTRDPCVQGEWFAATEKNSDKTDTYIYLTPVKNATFTV